MCTAVQSSSFPPSSRFGSALPTAKPNICSQWLRKAQCVHGGHDVEKITSAELLDALRAEHSVCSRLVKYHYCRRRQPCPYLHLAAFARPTARAKICGVAKTTDPLSIDANSNTYYELTDTTNQLMCLSLVLYGWCTLPHCYMSHKLQEIRLVPYHGIGDDPSRAATTPPSLSVKKRLASRDALDVSAIGAYKSARVM